MSDGRGAPRRLLYGRRQGRKLRRGRRALIEELLPKIEIVPPSAGRLEPRDLFPSPVAAVWLEIGFGAGEHLAAQARAHPGHGFIGCEPFVNGIASLLASVAQDDLANLRVFTDDARLLVDVLADASIDRLFVLFPDPWPKARHAKRRIVGPGTLDAFSRVLADGAEIRLATDHPGYCRWMLFHLGRHGDFEWLARRPGDWRQRPADWPETRYEAKARAKGDKPAFLRFRRLPRGSG